MEDQMIFDTGFFMAPNDIFEREDLGADEKIVFLYLCRCYDGVAALPSYDAIASSCSMSLKDVLEAVNNLTAKGLVDGGEQHEGN